MTKVIANIPPGTATLCLTYAAATQNPYSASTLSPAPAASTVKMPWKGVLCAKAAMLSGKTVVFLAASTVRMPWKSVLCTKAARLSGKRAVFLAASTVRMPWKAVLCAKVAMHFGKRAVFRAASTVRMPWKAVLCTKAVRNMMTQSRKSTDIGVNQLKKTKCLRQVKGANSKQLFITRLCKRRLLFFICSRAAHVPLFAGDVRRHMPCMPVLRRRSPRLQVTYAAICPVWPFCAAGPPNCR